MALNLIIKFSTYVFAFYAVTFCIIGYLACYGNQSSNKYAIKVKFQKVLIILTHLLAFFILFIQNPTSSIATIYVEQLLLILLILIFYNKIYPKANKILLNNVLFMLVIGFSMLQRLSPQSSVKQFYITAFCAIICLFLPVFIVKMKRLYKLKYFYALIGFVLLAVVSMYGEEIHGAKNWVYIGNYSLQLSELVKIILVFYLAATLYRHRDFKDVIITGIVTCVYIGFLVVQKDLGTALILFFVYMIVVFVSTKNFYYAIFGLVTASFASVVAYFLFSHVRVRVFAWLNPWEDIAGKGYQITQSLFAIGSGGWFGTGLNKGMPNKIPYVQTDYVFSGIAEELGVVFAIALIFIALNIVYIGYKISVKQMDPFKRLVSIGLTSLYGIQVFLVIGGVTKLIPHTGLTLPFISYGGSSIAVSLIVFTLLESYSIDGVKEEMPFKYLKAVRYGFCALFLLLATNITYFIMVDSSSVLVNSYNTRQDLLEETRIRGKILDSNGNILADSVLTAEGDYERIYPYKAMFSHVVGYASKGKSGLEAYANYELLKSDQNIWDKLVSSISDEKLVANNVVSTLDANLQEVAYNALGNNKGAVTVIEVATGKILAMVSKPDFNPNDIDLIWNDINTVEVTDSAILINRATQGLYPPGSTFKTLVALSYIRSNPDWKSYEYVCKGTGMFNNNRINCYGNRAHGTQNLIEAFANSCNAAFADIGTNMKIDQLQSVCESFLFDKKLPSQLLIKQSSFVLDGKSEPWEIPQTAIGQGKTAMTPMHNLMIMATIANGGIMMEPYLIDKIVNSYGVTVETFEPKAYDKIISAEEAKVLGEMLRSVVVEGTAKPLNKLDVEVVGKTGSAEFKDGEAAHAWFVGYAPYNNPEIAVCVLVENVGTSSDFSVPIAKKIFDAYQYKK